jgi:hypothetical protein
MLCSALQKFNENSFALVQCGYLLVNKKIVKKEDLDNPSSLEELIKRLKQLSILDKVLHNYQSQIGKVISERANLKREIEKFTSIRDNITMSPNDEHNQEYSICITENDKEGEFIRREERQEDDL